MDEVALHVTQQIEIFQVWLREVLQKSKEVVNSATSEVLSSQQFAVFLDGFKELVTSLSESWTDAVELITRVSFPKLIITSISSFVGNDMNRGTLTACCFGFTIGSGVGLVLGICLQAPSKPIYMMRAIAATNFTGPEGIAVLEDVPMPSVKSPDQVLIEVRYATLCQTDLQISNGYARVLRSILQPSNEPPVILGRSGSGTVVEVGSGVSCIELGDKVIFWCPAWSRGCLSQYVCLHSWQVATLPKGVSLEDGAWSAYPSVLAWKYIRDSMTNPKEFPSKRVFVHCGSNWIGDAVRRVLVSHGCDAAATTSQTPLTLESPSRFFPLSTAPLLINDPKHRHKYDIVFNTEGEGGEEFSHHLVRPQGKVIKAFPPTLRSDTFGAFLAFTFSFWFRATHNRKWEVEGIREGVRLTRSLGPAPLAHPPHTVDPSMVAISSVGAVLVSMEEFSRRKKMDTIKQ